jgi:hypothetical protein
VSGKSLGGLTQDGGFTTHGFECIFEFAAREIDLRTSWLRQSRGDIRECCVGRKRHARRQGARFGNANAIEFRKSRENARFAIREFREAREIRDANRFATCTDKREEFDVERACIVQRREKRRRIDAGRVWSRGRQWLRGVLHGVAAIRDSGRESNQEERATRKKSAQIAVKISVHAA